MKKTLALCLAALTLAAGAAFAQDKMNDGKMTDKSTKKSKKKSKSTDKMDKMDKMDKKTS